MSKIKTMIIFGTRPEAIKMATLVKAYQSDDRIENKVLVTAQHREMLDQVLNLFEIEPDYDLDIMQARQSLTDITSRVLRGLDEILKSERPDLVLVHGDTTTTFVAALASFYQQIKVGHVEAGLRTYNKYSPFPEEMNRHLTGSLADLHFAPTQRSRNNLLTENVQDKNIFVTGNTVIDALLETVKEDYTFQDEEIKKIDFNRKIILMTAHRRENLGEPMRNIFMAIKDLIEANDNLEIVFPVHLNPLVRELANEILGDIEHIHLIEPMDYEPFANIMYRSDLILTDSGGIQEEAPGLGKPVLVLRDTTERPEAIVAGTVKKVGTDRKKIFDTANRLINDRIEYNKMANAVNPYGDGRASSRILQRTLYEFKLVDSPGIEFVERNV